jgi:hypothetical protein
MRSNGSRNTWGFADRPCPTNSRLPMAGDPRRIAEDNSASGSSALSIAIAGTSRRSVQSKVAVNSQSSGGCSTENPASRSVAAAAVWAMVEQALKWATDELCQPPRRDPTTGLPGR